MITTLALIVVGAPSLAQEIEPWPLARQDRYGTGRARSGLDSASYSDAYVYRLMNAGMPESNLATPVLGAGAKAYYPTTTGLKQYDLYSAKGISQKQVPTEQGYKYVPAVNSEAGLAYACADGATGGIRAYTVPTPTKVWQLNLGAMAGSPTLGPTGDVFVGTRNGTIYRLNGLTGATQWQTGGLMGAQGNPVFTRDDLAVVVATTKNLRSLNAATGAQNWSRALTSTAGQPAVGPDGRIIVGSADGAIYSYAYQSGGRVWRIETGGQTLAAPAFGFDGTIYMGGTSGTGGMLYALNPKTGGLKWSVPTAEPIVFAPSVGHDGRVYVSAGGELLAVSRTGGILWRHNTLQGSGPITIGPDSMLYVGSNRGAMVVRQQPLQQEMTHAEGDPMMLEPDNDPDFRVVTGEPDGQYAIAHGMRPRPGASEFAMIHVRYGADLPRFKWFQIEMQTSAIHAASAVSRRVKLLDANEEKFVMYDVRPETSTDQLTVFTVSEDAMKWCWGNAVHIRISWVGSGDIEHSEGRLNWCRVRWVPEFNTFAP